MIEVLMNRASKNLKDTVMLCYVRVSLISKSETTRTISTSALLIPMIVRELIKLMAVMTIGERLELYL